MSVQLVRKNMLESQGSGGPEAQGNTDGKIRNIFCDIYEMAYTAQKKIDLNTSKGKL